MTASSRPPPFVPLGATARMEFWVDRLLAPLRRSAAGVSLVRSDWVAMTALWAAAAVWVWQGTGFFTGEAWFAHRALDLYFDADIPRTLEHMTRRHGLLWGPPRSHPNFSLLAYPPTAILIAMLGDRQAGIRAFQSAAVPTAGPLLYLIARGVGNGPAAATATTAAALASAAFTHWAPVPESFAFALPTIAAPFALLSASASRHLAAWVGVMALSGSVTVTNWVAGGLSALCRHALRPSVLVAVLGVLVVVVLRAAQAAFFDKTALFIDLEAVASRLRFVAVEAPPALQYAGGNVKAFTDFPWTLSDRLTTLLLYAGVAPPPNTRPVKNRTYLDLGYVLSIDEAPLASLGAVGATAALSWVGLLLLGLRAASLSPRRDVAAATIGFLIFHLALHMVFGELVFLFVLHGLPSFAALIAFALAGPQRRIALPLALVFIVTAAPTNAIRFNTAAEMANGLLHGTLRPTRL